MENKYGLFFRVLRRIARLFFPKYEVQLNETHSEPVVYISHHRNLFGPVTILMNIRSFIRPWVLHVFFHQKLCHEHYTKYTFTKRYGWNKWVAKSVAYPMSYLISLLLKSSKGIPVYRGKREVIDTFKHSVDALEAGNSIIIFPDIDYRDSSTAEKELYAGFLHIEKYYYRKTGKHVCFVPLYISKSQQTIIASREICFRDGINFKTERKRVLEEVQNSLRELAEIDAAG